AGRWSAPPPATPLTVTGAVSFPRLFFRSPLSSTPAAFFLSFSRRCRLLRRRFTHSTELKSPRRFPWPAREPVRPFFGDRSTTQQEERTVPDHKTSEDGSVHVDQPIFLDPQGRRRMWLRLLSGVTTGTGVFAVAACGLLFSEGPSASTGSLALPGKGVAFPRMMDDKVAYLSDGGRSSALMDGGDSTSPTARADDVSDEQAPPESSTTVAEPIGGGSTASVERLPTERDQVAEADIDGSEGTDPGNDAGAGEGTASDVAGTGKTDVEEIDGDDLRETEPPEAATSVEEAPE